MTKLLFHYNANAWCVVRSFGRTLQICHFTKPDEERNVVSFDPYQAALLIPELERFITQRHSNKVGDLTWRVTDGSLCINDIPVLDLGPSNDIQRLGAYEVISKMLTRGQSVDLFVGRPHYTTDLHMELWILERIETLSDEVDF